MNYNEEIFDDTHIDELAEDAAGYRDHNREMNQAWRFISDTSTSVFLSGKAGTGKTTFLRKLRELSPKRMVVLAPTGVAAINAQGQTIHSFFQLPFGPNVPGAEQVECKKNFKMGREKKNIIRTLDLLVIDEISMVRCDLLDAIDAELRKYRDRTLPFGGVQLLLIGDLQQLAPVAKESEWQLLAPHYSTPYFFGSRALQQLNYVTIELRHIYRQQDAHFIDILGKVRTNTLDAATLARLNDRHIPDFVIPEDEDWIRLTTHNRMAQEYNASQLAKLETPEQEFRCTVTGNFPESSYPADAQLVLKEGAQVMFIKNDPSMEHAYYNGKIGTVKGFGENCIFVYCKEDDSHISVPTLTWENTRYVLNSKSNEIEEVVDGTFVQYPLRLAWAITVHKSQGLTFDHAVLDINSSFAHGQVYVALSRCRTLEGLVLAKPLQSYSVINDTSVLTYMDNVLSAAPAYVQQYPKMRFDYYLSLLTEVFDYRNFMGDYQYLIRVSDEHLSASQANYVNVLKNLQDVCRVEVADVALRFQHQCYSYMTQSPDFIGNAQLQERIHAAMAYFSEKLHLYFDDIIEAQDNIEIGNKTVKTQYENALEAFMLSLQLKLGVYRRMADKPFTVTEYLRAKAQSMLDDLRKSLREAKKAVKKPKTPTHLITLDMFQEGKSIDEIAAERGLVSSTISSHLEKCIMTGLLPIEALVTPEQQRTILEVLAKTAPETPITDILPQLPEGYTYSQVRLVRLKQQ